jgi:hypothetical protein
MGWVRMAMGARWFPYALIGIPLLVSIVFGWGYFKGYGSASEKSAIALNKALAEQLVEVLAQKELELRLAVRAEAKKHAIAKKISQVPKPTASCELKPVCLQWYDNILRASTTDRREPD